MTKEKRVKEKVFSAYDIESKKYILYMCKAGCIFYNNGCIKHRNVRDCAKKGLKNKK